jgi:hypothetical protein
MPGVGDRGSDSDFKGIAQNGFGHPFFFTNVKPAISDGGNGRTCRFFILSGCRLAQIKPGLDTNLQNDTFHISPRPAVYNASQKDRHSRFAGLTRSHTKLRGGLIAALLLPVVLYLANSAAAFV